MYKAIKESNHLPPVVKSTLFGDISSAQAAKFEKTSVNPGCAQYLEGLRNTSAKVDKPQIDALRSVLANIGECAPTSSSFSLIHGPPGTEKTNTLLYLIGALLYHSAAGHIERKQRHQLKDHLPQDNIERYRESPGGIRILVCAPSNKGVDNILERLDWDGIPDGKGGRIWPQAARIAKAGHDHANLSSYSIAQKALPFDQYIHNIGANRKNPSSKARKSFFGECVVLLTTLVSSGSSTFRNCVPFDLVFTDETGQANEPETLIPLSNVSRRSNRCQFVAVGDHHQLPPIAVASHSMRCIGQRIHFDYDKQMMSIFRRIQQQKRAPSRMLTTQYRMCRAVADVNNMNFYDGLLKSFLPESSVDAPYNKGWDPATGCFYRMTSIDTTLIALWREISSKNGEYRNVEEIKIIEKVLHRIKKLSGNTFAELRGEIAVLVPYRSQGEHARLFLERTGT